MLITYVVSTGEIQHSIKGFPECEISGGTLFIGNKPICDADGMAYKYIEDIVVPQFDDRQATLNDIAFTEVVNPVIPKKLFRSNVLSGLTQAQLESYIDSNVTTLPQARAFLKKLGAIVLLLAKHTDLDK